MVKEENNITKKILFVSDLDGTLLNNQHEVSEKNVKAIEKFKSNGGLFTFATGRMEETTLPYVDKLNINIPLISYNGARLYCPITKKVIFEERMSVPVDIWELILKVKQPMGVFIYKDNQPFVLKRNEIVEEFERKEGFTCKDGSLDDFIEGSISKILIIMKALSDSEKVPALQVLEDEIKVSEFSCESVFSEVNYLEILPKGTSKGKGLARLIDYLGEKEIHTIAIGDNLNDIPLLTVANTGIAVRNAQSKLKGVADLVLDQNNDEHAIAYVIENVIAKEKLDHISLTDNM